MSEFLPVLGWVLLGIVVGRGAAAITFRKFLHRRVGGNALISELVQKHFHPVALDNISISERQFPFRVRADVQRAIDKLFGSETSIMHFCGIRKEYAHEGVALADCITPTDHYPAVSAPPQYEDIDVGAAEPIRCLKTGLWFLRHGTDKFVVLLAPVSRYGRTTGI